MAGFKPDRLWRGFHHISSPETTTCTIADTYYKISGTWGDGDDCNHGFAFDGSGKITFQGQSGAYLLFNGASDLSADKVATVTYAMYLNGALVTGGESPVSIQHANENVNLSITNFVKLNPGDYIEIYVKSNTANTDVTSSTLFLTFLGQ